MFTPAATFTKYLRQVFKRLAPRVARQPVFIQFRGGSAFVGRTGQDAGGNPVDLYKILDATTRVEAMAKIRLIRGFGSEFKFDASEEAKTAPREVAAAK